MRHAPALVASALLLLSGGAAAATYTVGPSGRQYTQLSTLFNAVDLQPGDVVLVDGNATYSGGIVVGSNDAGAPGNEVVIRWTGAAGQTRPRLHGGQHTIKFQHSHHVRLEGFEVTGGTSTCIFNEANGVTVRDVIVHDCPSHGILGADQNSGSFTLEYSELYRNGAGTTRHTIYMQNDQMVYPDATFLMRFNYVHDGNGGILMRSRYSRSQIYFNWFEASTNEAVEFIGPDCQAQKPGWSAGLRREDADFVGNVIVHTSAWRNAIRLGGDLVGRSQGRVRLVGNSIVFMRDGNSNAVRVQLGVESLEMHNNLLYKPPGSFPLTALDENLDVATPYCGPMSTAPWVAGRQVHGSRNWVVAGAVRVPPEWSGTLSGPDPLLASIANRQLRPLARSPLVDAATNTPAPFAAHPLPWPLPETYYDPPLRTKLAPGSARPRLPWTYPLDIGALEVLGIDAYPQPIPERGAEPPIPPAGPALGTAVAQPVIVRAPAPPLRGPVRVWMEAAFTRMTLGFERFMQGLHALFGGQPSRAGQPSCAEAGNDAACRNVARPD